MTLQEASIDSDISIWYNGIEDVLSIGWYWDINCGYQSYMNKGVFETPTEAYNNLLTFLETWEGPTK